MNLNVSIANISARFKRSSTAVFWAALIVLIILEVMVLRRSVAIALSLRKPPPAPLPNRSVRVNFSAYDEVIKRIESGQQGGLQNLQSLPVIPAEPFGETGALAAPAPSTAPSKSGTSRQPVPSSAPEQ